MQAYMTKKEVAKFFSISTKTVERRVKANILPKPTYDLGPKLPRWPIEAIRNVMESSQGVDTLNVSR